MRPPASPRLCGRYWGAYTHGSWECKHQLGICTGLGHGCAGRGASIVLRSAAALLVLRLSGAGVLANVSCMLVQGSLRVPAAIVALSMPRLLLY